MAEALHQRGAGAERGQPHQDGEGPGGRSAHHLPTPGADGGGKARRGASPRPPGLGRMTSVSCPRRGRAALPSGKSLDFAAIRPGSPLAPRRVARICVPAILLVLAQGCLMPQSVDPANTRPHTIPRVDVTTNPPCHCQLDVGISAIIADDPTVDVDVRVFVDYDVNVPRSQPPVSTLRLPGSFTVSDTTRFLSAPIPFDSSGLGGPGLHVVELVIGETGGFAADTVFPPHRAMLSTFESSTFKFVVQVLAPDPTRQSCGDRQLPPQVKSCP